MGEEQAISAKANKVSPLRKPVKCPNCKSQSMRETYPFCSTRCRDVDLNRWFLGSYAIPTAENNDEFGSEFGEVYDGENSS